MSAELDTINTLLVDFEEDKLLEVVRNCLLAGDDPMAIVERCRDGMAEVGKRFAAGEFFVNELICSADLFGGVMKTLGPQLSAKGSGATKGRVVVGTVKGDVHDIGKDIVVAMLRCDGFEVYDLGVNIPAQQFVDKVRETGAKVVGLSGLLTLAFDGMEETVKALKATGLDVKVMIGGGMTNEMVRVKVGADACGHDAIEAVRLAKSFSGVS
jgi:methanogenic corrinoid protein MtbC1